MNKKIFKNEFLRQQWLLYFITIISILITSSVRIVGYNILKRDSIDYGYTMYVQGYGLLLALSLLSVVLIPIIMFSYMHSKEKLDLFHSLPITRTNLFLNKYLIGLSYFLISYFLTVIVMFIIDKIYCPNLTSLNFHYILFLIKNGLFFVLIYTVFALSNTIMGITAYAVFCGILLFFAPFILYDTYLALYDSFNVPLSTFYLTPNFFVNYFDDILNEKLFDTSRYIMYIVSMVVLIVMILISAISIYNKRDSEKSRTSVAVSKFEIPLKTLILYIVFVTTLFVVVSWDDLSILNAIIIMIVVITVTVATVEVIFNRSIKNINFKNLVYSALSALYILVVVFITAKIDIFDTRHYAPSEDTISYIEITYNSPDYNRSSETILLTNIDEIQKFYELADKLAEVSYDDYYYTENLLYEFDVCYITDDATYTRYFYFENEDLVYEVLDIPDNNYKNSLFIANKLLNNNDTSVYFDKSEYSASFYHEQNFDKDLYEKYPYNRDDYDNYLVEENVEGEQIVTALSTDISKILINNQSPQPYLPLMTYEVSSSIPQNWLYDTYLSSGTLYVTNEYVETLKFFKDNNIKFDKQSYSIYKIKDEQMLITLKELVESDEYNYYSCVDGSYNSTVTIEYIKENMELVDTFSNFDKEKTLSYTIYTNEIDDSVMLQEDTYILLNRSFRNPDPLNYRFVKKVK